MQQKQNAAPFRPEADLSIKYRHLIWTDEQLAAAEPGSVTFIYARRSPRPGEDDTISLENQVTNGVMVAEQRGAKHVALFLDQSVSASNPKKPRPEYDRIVKWLKAGVFADGICRDSERLYRLPRELEDLIDLLDSRNVPIYLTHDTVFDLTSPGGRMSARIRVSINRNYVEEMSKKRNLTELERVRQGLISTGPAPFGYVKNAEKTSYLIVPDQAQAIREAYTYLRAMDGTLAEIARQWNAAGLRNTKGREWKWAAVKRTLLNPAICARRAYQRHTYLYESASSPKEVWEAELTQGNWEPIVSFEEWNALKLLLTRTKSKVGNAKRYWGAGMYRCPEFEACPPLKSIWGGRGASRARYYTCRDGAGHTHIKADRIDAYVQGLLMGYLSDPDQFAALLNRKDEAAEDAAGVEARRREEQRAELERTSAELGEAFAIGAISMKAFLAGEDRIKRELAALGSVDLPVVAATVAQIPWEQVAERWESLEVEAKQHVLSQVFPTIIVFPTGKTAKKPPIADYVHVYDYRGRLLPLVDDEDTFITRAAQRAMAARHGTALLEPDATGPESLR